MGKNLETLIDFLRTAADVVLEETNNDFEVDSTVLREAINDSLRETSGKPTDKTLFEELVIINFIIRSNESGASAKEIREAVRELSLGSEQ